MSITYQFDSPESYRYHVSIPAIRVKEKMEELECTRLLAEYFISLEDTVAQLSAELEVANRNILLLIAKTSNK